MGDKRQETRYGRGYVKARRREKREEGRRETEKSRREKEKGDKR